MDDKDAKKCKYCEATLVGKKAHKLGLCSNCERELGQKVAGGVAVLGSVLAVWQIIKNIIKKH